MNITSPMNIYNIIPVNSILLAIEYKYRTILQTVPIVADNIIAEYSDLISRRCLNIIGIPRAFIIRSTKIPI